MSLLDGFGILIKGRNISTKMLRTLNSLIVDEFNAIHHYMVHSAVCGGWGYKALEDKFYEESREELGHSKILMDRITVFDKVPTLNQFPSVERPTDVKNMIEKQIELENGALKGYNDAVIQARNEGDNGTKDILNSILMDEERHYDWLKEQSDKIKGLGLELYLLSQVEGEESEKAMGVAAAAPMAVESLDTKLKPDLAANSPRSSGGPASVRAAKAVGSKAISGGQTSLPLGKAVPMVGQPGGLGSSPRPKSNPTSGPSYPTGMRPALHNQVGGRPLPENRTGGRPVALRVNDEQTYQKD